MSSVLNATKSFSSTLKIVAQKYSMESRSTRLNSSQLVSTTAMVIRSQNVPYQLPGDPRIKALVVPSISSTWWMRVAELVSSVPSTWKTADTMRVLKILQLGDISKMLERTGKVHLEKVIRFSLVWKVIFAQVPWWDNGDAKFAIRWNWLGMVYSSA